MDLVRRPGGAVEPHRRPAGRRVLLPAEIELCDVLGLSVDDYFFFLELTQGYSGVRPKEYDHIPDIRNDPVTWAVVASLAVGVALQAVSYLLTPKPRAPQVSQRETPPNLRTADVTGAKRFAPQTSFDSVQELATLGTTIPLVFTRKGVRVNGTLLWSQLRSLGIGQQLRALVLFSAGELEQRPDFAGFAIGDTLLANYANSKIALYFKTNGGRPQENSTDRYPEGTADNFPNPDAFSLFWERTGSYQPFFCGTRSPSTQSQFGAYSPMPNGMKYKVNYELVLRPQDVDGEVLRDNNTKWAKVNTLESPRLAAVIATSRSGNTPGPISVSVGDTIIYELNSGSIKEDEFLPWGVQDIKSSVESERINADEAISLGEEYLIGTAVGVAITVPSTPWEIGVSKLSTFRITRAGIVDVRSVFDVLGPYQTLAVQRVAIATVTNNRACDSTEIGIKSTVWRQINGFANVNSYPGDSTVSYYESKNGAISLGSVSKYIKRLSFFVLQIRPLGTTNWQNLSNATLYCVRGQTPQPQYNFIRINHTRGQYEYRLVPYPGNRAFVEYLNRDVFLLEQGSRYSYSQNGYSVTFSGSLLRLTPNVISNPEWILGLPPKPVTTGEVESVSSYSNGDIPYRSEWQSQGTRNDANNRVSNPRGTFLIYWKWDGVNVASTQLAQTEVVIGPSRYVRGTTGSNDLVTGSTVYSITRFDQTQVEVEAPTFSGVVSAVGGGGSGLTFNVRRFSNGSATWTIASPGSGYSSGATVTIPQANVTVTVKTADSNFITAKNLNPYDAIADYVLYDAERSSHQDGPEHEVVYVNEVLQQQQPNYTGLAIAGLRINSSREWTSFNQLSAFIRSGIRIERPGLSGRAASNLLPDIAYALLTDPTIGAGQLIGKSAVNESRMRTASQFCQANGFTWDGVIAENLNLRQWIFEQAGYCLLDFTIIGGQFSLIPSVPYGGDFRIAPNQAPQIKALFTDGNIRDLKVTFLSPEERQLFRATVLWRFDTLNGFPETRVLTIRLSESQGGSAGDPEETFDMSGFCTTQEHALTFARYALKTRKEVDHGIKFQTTPQAAMSLAPGDYFRLVSEATHTSRFQNGSIDSNGNVTSAQPLSGATTVLYWVPGTTAVQEATLTVNNGVAAETALRGTLFTVKNTTTVNRVYKVESLSYAEDGLVEVAASYAPLSASGGLAVLNWPDSDFVAEFY